ncbi:putative cytoskeletal regulatory protein binding [Lyophyllum shimeji]|uniref:Cytoskeletal regulatory protein binding n=1 Tax=Lyophyllum shimeji TaxID=47721 RepID=A0A9P3PUT3_LYOSH|nr:putative cytoskeletal regulatory protein binding [Lyophyllum shimeji]
MASQSRSSASSSSSNITGSRASTSRNQGDVPGTVRSLLLSTKQLQDLLKQWSLGQATEGQVSDAYVQIGQDFNNTIRAFAYHQIDLSDIHSIPGELRVPLEQCLGEDPSPEVLQNYMPQVKQVLYKLLRGLQARQDAWRAAGGRMPSDTR